MAERCAVYGNDALTSMVACVPVANTQTSTLSLDLDLIESVMDCMIAVPVPCSFLLLHLSSLVTSDALSSITSH